MKTYAVRKIITQFSNLKQYFLRGHIAWFALVFSLINFTLIFYTLFYKQLSFIPEDLQSYSSFIILFILLYFPGATVLGYLDYKKGTYSAEQLLNKELSPVWRELFALLEKLEENNVEIRKLLEK